MVLHAEQIVAIMSKKKTNYNSVFTQILLEASCWQPQIILAMD